MSRKEYYQQYDALRSVPSRLLRAAKDRCRKSGVPITITVEDIIVPPSCPICEKAIQPAIGSKGGSATSPSLDRVVPAKGYVPGNVAVLCKKCNSMKGDMTPEMLRRMADYIEAYQ